MSEMGNGAALYQSISPVHAIVDLCRGLSYKAENVKAKIAEISSDTHQLQFIKLHDFKLEIFKSS